MITEILEAYKLQLLYAALVIISVVLLRYITNLLHKWFIKREEKRFPGEISRPIYLIKKILNGLWLVLGVLLLAFIFSGDMDYKSLISDFKFIFYLGFLLVCTIVCATSVNLWFKQSIAKKISSHEDPTSLKFLGYVAVYGIYF